MADPSAAAHVLVLMYPTQGHINPMLQFSKNLVSYSKDVKVSLITALISEKCFSTSNKNINVVILDDEDGTNKAPPKGVDELVGMFKSIMDQKLTDFINKQKQVMRSHDHNNTPKMILVYDSSMPWADHFAKQSDLLSAAFFTQSCSVTALYYHFKNGNLNIPPTPTDHLCLPNLPPFLINDLPSFIVKKGTFPLLTTLMADQSDNFGKADWILFNTFDALEPEEVKWTSSKCVVKTIGPTIPSRYLGMKVENEDENDMNHYGFNLYEPKTDTCIKWLNGMEEGSVVYVSFGSMASLSKEQMEELGYGLMNSKCHFLWVVRSGEEEANIPSWFKEKSCDHQGQIVSWCPQLAVLAHKAVGCFVTHCGWNSTMEAISSGVPMVAMPQWSDQMTNAKYIEDVWGVGVRAEFDDIRGVFTRQEIETCVNKVMKINKDDDDQCNNYRKNALELKKLAMESVREGGTSYNNIQDFISRLLN
ncbi:UDP glycosyltransferase 9-like [Impatiens glandulifera]|uniref:UDP glycosyltransferase 9-like n=1 Tax=Impatiens glandulifera TaxID=253017 RepID=UPI001FB0D733|nr:UDP glycosyltransferase 9-like [Impatiens glandulifera]